MCTGLSQILNYNEQSPPLLGAIMYVYVYQATQMMTDDKADEISLAVTDNEINSLTLHTVTAVTPLTFVLWLC